MTIPAKAPRYAVKQDDVDRASRIMLEHLNQALAQMHASGLEPGAALQAAVQMSMRLYADLVDDDGEAIRQLRWFLDQWESDYLAVDEAAVH